MNKLLDKNVSGFLNGIDRTNWTTTTIGQVVEIYSGGTPSTEIAEYWEGDIPWCTPTDITRNDAKYISQTERNISNSGLKHSAAILMPKGSLLLCSRATIGEVKIAGCPIATNQGFKNLICHDNIDVNFMYYLLKTLKKEMFSKANGSTFLEISKSQLASIEIKIPSYIIQNDIANVLMSIDEEILYLTRLFSKYESIKKATVNLLLKPKEGWQEIQIGNVCQEVHERVSCSELTINTYISTENLVPERQGIVPASSVPIGINAIRFQRNDILVSNIRPYLKKIWYADFWGGCSNDVIVYRANEKVNPRFLFHLLSQDAFFNFAMDNATGTKMPRGDRKLLQLFAISIPSSLSEQEQISISIDKLSLILDNIYKSIKKLEKHKHSLLQYFFN